MKCLLFRPLQRDSNVLRSEPKVNITAAWCCGCMLAHDVAYVPPSPPCSSLTTLPTLPPRPFASALTSTGNTPPADLAVNFMFPTVHTSPLKVSFSEAPHHHPITCSLLFFFTKVITPRFHYVFAYCHSSPERRTPSI